MVQHLDPVDGFGQVFYFQNFLARLPVHVKGHKGSLEYVVVDEFGPAHNKTFKVIVKIDDIIYGEGIAHSKKEAEQKAAHDALKKAQNG